MKAFTVKLKDGRTVKIRMFQPQDKDKLIEMYESLSSDAVRWGMPPYTRERLEEGWFRNLQNITAIVAFHGDKLLGMLKFLNSLTQDGRGQRTFSHIFIKTFKVSVWAPPCSPS